MAAGVDKGGFMESEDFEDLEDKEFEDRERKKQFIADNTPIYSGFYRIAGLDGLNIMTTYDWSLWRKLPTAQLWEMVALHCFINPEGINPEILGSDQPVKHRSAVWYYRQRIAIARLHVEEGLLVANSSESDLNERRISFPAYADWADELEMPLPYHFPKKPLNRLVGRASMSTRSWPWGSHETKLLGMLALAGEFWKTVEEGGNYDPEDDTTAPTNDQIESFLMRQGVTSNKIREAMATILRSDNLPDGRRKSKR